MAAYELARMNGWKTELITRGYAIMSRPNAKKIVVHFATCTVWLSGSN